MGGGVPSREYYLQQAKSYFDRATTARDKDRAARCVERANEYLILADALGREPYQAVDRPQQQQQQQQQQQSTDDAGSDRQRSTDGAGSDRQRSTDGAGSDRQRSTDG